MSRIRLSPGVLISAMVLVCHVGYGGQGAVGRYRPMHDDPTSNMCGIKCIFALHRAMGDRVTTIERIARECEWEWGRQINLLDIKQYLVKYHFGPSALRISAEELSVDSFYFIPVRVGNSQEYNHLYMIMNRVGEEIVYFDGNRAVKRDKMAAIRSMWDGECIAVKKEMQPPSRKAIGMEFVYIASDQPFYVSKHEITNRHYEAFLQSMKAGEYAHEFCYDVKCERDHSIKTRSKGEVDPNCPVTNVTWFDAYAFCKWLGPEYQLPSRVHYQDMTPNIGKGKRLRKVKQYVSDEPIPVDQNREENLTGIVGLFSSVAEYTVDHASDMSPAHKEDIYVFESDVDGQAYAFHFLTPHGRSAKMGFRVVKVR